MLARVKDTLKLIKSSSALQINVQTLHQLKKSIQVVIWMDLKLSPKEETIIEQILEFISIYAVFFPVVKNETKIKKGGVASETSLLEDLETSAKRPPPVHGSKLADSGTFMYLFRYAASDDSFQIWCATVHETPTRD